MVAHQDPSNVQIALSGRSASHTSVDYLRAGQSARIIQPRTIGMLRGGNKC